MKIKVVIWLGIGGSEGEGDSANQSLDNLSQMEKDAVYIKNNYNIVTPTKGVITSKFGPRTPTEIISANHAGLDIGNVEGTKIVACMDGKVTYVSSQGDYGNHIKIETGNIVTLYAHCRKIYVSEGVEVKAGTEIAEMGSTGRATGSHLHIEIKVENRLVDPEYVIEI